MREDSAFLINHALRSKGLASLDQAGALAGQLAMFVRDDAHFRALINACEPKERGHMYDALAPNLPFRPRLLHEYLIELAQDAERRQLPTIGENGQLRQFHSPEIRSEPGSDAAIATEALVEANAKERLHVVCLLCTRGDTFRGATKDAAVHELRAAGWRAGFKLRADDSGERDQVEICPRCVKKRAPRMRAA